MNQRWKKRKVQRLLIIHRGYELASEKRRSAPQHWWFNFELLLVQLCQKKKKQSWKRSLMWSTEEMKLQKCLQSSGSCANNTVCEDRWPHHIYVTFMTGWDRWEKRWIWHGVQGSPRIFHQNIKSIHIPRLCWEFPFYRCWCLFKQRSRKYTWPIGRAGRGRQMMMNTISSALTANKSKHFITFHIYSSTVINWPEIWWALGVLQVNCKKSRNVAAENGDLTADEWT